jgi:hypothetical protein
MNIKNIKAWNVLLYFIKYVIQKYLKKKSQISLSPIFMLQIQFPYDEEFVRDLITFDLDLMYVTVTLY